MSTKIASNSRRSSNLSWLHNVKTLYVGGGGLNCILKYSLYSSKYLIEFGLLTVMLVLGLKTPFTKIFEDLKVIWVTSHDCLRSVNDNAHSNFRDVNLLLCFSSWCQRHPCDQLCCVVTPLGLNQELLCVDTEQINIYLDDFVANVKKYILGC
jgi:hypothetical protein